MTGIKHDNGKVRLELYPPEALFATSDVLTYGATKYAERNWERGLKFSRVFGALMRHLWAWWMGQDIDLETGKNHLHHAACCLAFLQTYVERKMVAWDDRAQAAEEKPATTIEEQTVEAYRAWFNDPLGDHQRQQNG